jgi:hypothetical protein
MSQSDDARRGTIVERARIRKYVSANAAYFAAQAGVSIETVESWDGTDAAMRDLMGKDQKLRFESLVISYAMVGVLAFIDGEDLTPLVTQAASPSLRPRLPRNRRKRW